VIHFLEGESVIPMFVARRFSPASKSSATALGCRWRSGTSSAPKQGAESALSSFGFWRRAALERTAASGIASGVFLRFGDAGSIPLTLDRLEARVVALKLADEEALMLL
jgi:hypothetical protein